MTHAIRFARVGGPELLMLEEVPLPPPLAREVLLRQHAIGVNFVDMYQRSGLYPVPLPPGLGSEAAGVVEQLVKIEIGQRFPLAEAGAAHRALESRSTRGSTLLSV